MFLRHGYDGYMRKDAWEKAKPEFLRSIRLERQVEQRRRLLAMQMLTTAAKRVRRAPWDACSGARRMLACAAGATHAAPGMKHIEVEKPQVQV